MKYLQWLLLWVGISVVVGIQVLIIFSMNKNKNRDMSILTIARYTKPITVVLPVKYIFDVKDGLTVKKLERIRLYGYNNTVAQCDSTPNIARSGRQVYEGSCAISQDLWKSKEVRFGDKLYIEKYNIFCVVEDTLNIKHTKSLDIFCYDRQVALSIGGTSNIYILRITK